MLNMFMFPAVGLATMDALALMVWLTACATLGAGRSIMIASEDQHLLAKAGSPGVTFNADILPDAGHHVYNILLFYMDNKPVARPSYNQTGPVMIINDGYEDHFEILATTLPRVSVKLNKPNMTSHTQLFQWVMTAPPLAANVSLIVSDLPVLVLPNEILEGEDIQIECSVRFGRLSKDGDGKITIYPVIGSGKALDAMGHGQIEGDLNETGVVTKKYTYVHKFQAQDNGNELYCYALLTASSVHHLVIAERLNILYLPKAPISFGDIPKDSKYAVGQQISCSAGGNPGPEIYEWTDLTNPKHQVQSQTLYLTEAMVGTRQFWMCKATYASSLQMNGTIDFSVDLPGVSISFGDISKELKYSVGQQINCSVEGHPGPVSYEWTDLTNPIYQIQGHTLDLTKAMVGTRQFWMCKAAFVSGLRINATIAFSVVNVDVFPSQSTSSAGDAAIAMGVVVGLLVFVGVGLAIYIKRKPN